MEKLTLVTFLKKRTSRPEIEKNHEKGARLAKNIETAEATLAGPQDLLAQVTKSFEASKTERPD